MIIMNEFTNCFFSKSFIVKENVQLQLEASYRERLMAVYEQVKKRMVHA